MSCTECVTRIEKRWQLTPNLAFYGASWTWSYSSNVQLSMQDREQRHRTQNIDEMDFQTYYRGGSQRIINWHNKVYRYWCQVWHQIRRLPKLPNNTFYAHFEGFWLPSYVISKLTSICVNLIMSIYFLWTFHSPGIWFFDNRHLFDNLTSFDITYVPITHGNRGDGA